MEAKVRTFVQRLEDVKGCDIFPNPKAVKPPKTESKFDEYVWYLGLQVTAGETYDLSTVT